MAWQGSCTLSAPVPERVAWRKWSLRVNIGDSYRCRNKLALNKISPKPKPLGITDLPCHRDTSSFIERSLGLALWLLLKKSLSLKWDTCDTWKDQPLALGSTLSLDFVLFLYQLSALNVLLSTPATLSAALTLRPSKMSCFADEAEMIDVSKDSTTFFRVKQCTKLQSFKIWGYNSGISGTEVIWTTKLCRWVSYFRSFEGTLKLVPSKRRKSLAQRTVPPPAPCTRLQLTHSQTRTSPDVEQCNPFCCVQLPLNFSFYFSSLCSTKMPFFSHPFSSKVFTGVLAKIANVKPPPPQVIWLQLALFTKYYWINNSRRIRWTGNVARMTTKTKKCMVFGGHTKRNEIAWHT